MNNVYTYLVKLPDGINEIVAPCADGYTVYLDNRLDAVRRDRAYRHALEHIRRGDFQKEDVQEIEAGMKRTVESNRKEGGAVTSPSPKGETI